MSVFRWIIASGGAVALGIMWSYMRAQIARGTPGADPSLPTAAKIGGAAFGAAAVFELALKSQFLWAAISITTLLLGFQLALTSVKEFFDQYFYLNLLLPWFLAAGISSASSTARGDAGVIIGVAFILSALFFLAKDFWNYNDFGATTPHAGTLLFVPDGGMREFYVRPRQTLRWTITGEVALYSKDRNIVFKCGEAWPGMRSESGGGYYFASCGRGAASVQINE